MSAFVTRFLCATVANWHAQVLARCAFYANQISLGVGTASYGLTVVDARIGVYFQLAFEGDFVTREEYYIRGLLETSIVPPQFWYNAKGFNDPTLASDAIPTGVDPDDYASLLGDLVDGTLNDIVRTTTTGSVTVLDVAAVAMPYDGLAQIQIIAKYELDDLLYANVTTFQVGQSASITESGDTININYPDAPPPVSEAAGNAYGAVALDRIADALEVFSLANFDLSINHGQAAWSVTSKITSG